MIVGNITLHFAELILLAKSRADAAGEAFPLPTFSAPPIPPTARPVPLAALLQAAELPTDLVSATVVDVYEGVLSVGEQPTLKLVLALRGDWSCDIRLHVLTLQNYVRLFGWFGPETDHWLDRRIALERGSRLLDGERVPTLVVVRVEDS